MRRARFLSPWKDSHEKPVLYHVINRIVERRFALGLEEKERIRTLMRMMEKFTGCRVRYFTDGVVIGSKGFVDDALEAARERFSERRKDGSRRMRGSGKAAAGVLWSARDLRVGIG